MNSNSLISKPTYVTKFLHTDQTYAEQFQELTVSLIAGNIALWRPGLARAVHNGADTLIVDPMTHAFTYQGYLNKKTYTELPYCPPAPLTATTLLASPEELMEFTRAVLRFQVDQGAGILVAPYFYTRDIDDARLAANIRFVASAAELHTEIGDSLPLYAWACIGSSILLSPSQTTEVARVYQAMPVDGYLVTAENFDDRYVNEQSLMGLSRFMLDLTEGKDVVVCSIAAFGQVLTALGANGFSAGIGWLETFREVSLKPGEASFAGDRVHRAHYYYIPELLSYVHPDDLRTIFDEQTGSETMRKYYACDCEVCNGGLPEEAEDKKRHFMLRRHQEMAELAELELADRPGHMRNRLQLALELSNILEEEALVRIPAEHFVRWIAILDRLAPPSSRDVDDGLGPDEIQDIIQQTREDLSGQGSS